MKGALLSLRVTPLVIRPARALTLHRLPFVPRAGRSLPGRLAAGLAWPPRAHTNMLIVARLLGRVTSSYGTPVSGPRKYLLKSSE